MLLFYTKSQKNTNIFSKINKIQVYHKINYKSFFELKLNYLFKIKNNFKLSVLLYCPLQSRFVVAEVDLKQTRPLRLFHKKAGFLLKS